MVGVYCTDLPGENRSLVGVAEDAVVYDTHDEFDTREAAAIIFLGYKYFIYDDSILTKISGKTCGRWSRNMNVINSGLIST